MGTSGKTRHLCTATLQLDILIYSRTYRAPLDSDRISTPFVPAASRSISLQSDRYNIAGKITDARIKELQSLRERKNDIAEKLQTKQDAMQDLLNAMDEATQDSTQSSSRAALEKRGKNKGKPVFSHQDALEVNQLEIARLEEDYAEVVKELEDFEALKDGV